MIKEFNFDSLEKSIPERSSNSHKGDFGKVMVVGGSEGMGGAAILSSEASLFSGAGLVHLSTHPINVEASASTFIAVSYTHLTLPTNRCV